MKKHNKYIKISDKEIQQINDLVYEEAYKESQGKHTMPIITIFIVELERRGFKILRRPI